MKYLRLTVNWGIILFSPVWVLPFLIYMAVTNQIYPREEFLVYGEKWLWE